VSASNWALVTGASKGIGAATARALASAGRDVLVHYGNDRDGAEEVASACRGHGVDARAVGADLRDSTDALVAAIDDVGGVGVLVNNAGVTADGLALSMSDDQFALTWQVNVAAAFTLCRAALRGMLRARSGRVVNVTSVVGLHGNPGQANYAASKAALVGVTKTLAREVGKRNITVNAVAPGFVATAMTAAVDPGELLARIPAARLGTAEDVAAVVAFLCSDAAAYVNGAVVQVDGGLFA
jgi:3-oxoacyl-[acyl-carrier protein] reductase